MLVEILGFASVLATARRCAAGALLLLLALSLSCAGLPGARDPLPAWNAGPAREAILDFVAKAIDPASPGYVAPADRIATFDNDGTLWVSHPLYTQGVFALDRVRALASEHPEWSAEEPFRAVLESDEEAISRFDQQDWVRILAATHTGMSTARFEQVAREWLATARHPRFGRLYTELVYAPMLELLHYLRQHGFETWIVSGGGQEFLRVFADATYGVPSQQVVGSSVVTRYEMRDGGPVLVREPEAFLVDDRAGKAIGIQLFIGKRPVAAFGNSGGDQEMLEWTTAGEGPRLGVLVLHDDPVREYAYGPALGLPETKVGAFPQALYDRARERGWTVVSMKTDWKRIFAWD